VASDSFEKAQCTILVRPCPGQFHSMRTILACRVKLIHCPCGAPKDVFTSRSEPDDDFSVSRDDFSVSRKKFLLQKSGFRLI
jgi:hypothetical protein